MKILDHSSNLKALGITCSIAMGMFDGVHLGHKNVIKAAVDHAYSHKQKSAIITLASHPRELTQGKSPELITNLSARLNLFERLGVDFVLVLDFNKQLQETSARDFFEKYLLNFLNTNFISIGYDHHFGKNRSGNPEILKKWCQEFNVQCHIEPALTFQGENISSSRIRNLIKNGNLDLSNKLLGHDYLICSEVIQGEGLGRELGYPTANLAVDENLVCPAHGVYYGHCQIGNNVQNYKCVVNIGVRPTVSTLQKTNIEVHILEFNNLSQDKKNIYGQGIQLSLSTRIRNEIKFNSVSELQTQIARDIEFALTQP
jgi:riboflavin kinase/FMN adenylyltransferase